MELASTSRPDAVYSVTCRLRQQIIASGGAEPVFGAAALAVTYCSAQGPHDQYYFNQPAMVRGVVRAPALELANRDLMEAH